ncbi:hypothetical protein CBS101457_000737 [Exobasidium rhododendri]|nr:hypothetical protein CBS101457_000737 [Exobasidium rhododendri]
MNNVREVNRINEKELELAVEGGASWHDDYKDSAYIFAGNLDKRLTEGDVIAIFSQYGEILDINLPRVPEGGLREQRGDGQGSSRDDPQRQLRQQNEQQGGKAGDRRGFGFLLYEDQKSTVLAVDNLNGFNLLGKTIRVDHVRDYKMPGAKQREEEGELVVPSRNAAPAKVQSPREAAEVYEDDIDLADPMASYIAESKKSRGRDKGDKVRSEHKKEKSERRAERKRKEREEEDRDAARERRDERHRREYQDYPPRKRRSEEEPLQRSEKDHYSERSKKEQLDRSRTTTR